MLIELLPIPLIFRRREREQKKAARGKKAPAKNKRKAPAKKKAAPAKRKAPARKKKVETESESEEDYDEEEDPVTMGDEALAKSLAGKRVSARNLDKKGKQFQKRAALAKLREVRICACHVSRSLFGVMSTNLKNHLHSTCGADSRE